ncbi:MAG: hypothetical protein AABY27_05805 [Pseudomonadota bacterium]
MSQKDLHEYITSEVFNLNDIEEFEHSEVKDLELGTKEIVKFYETNVGNVDQNDKVFIRSKAILNYLEERQLPVLAEKHQIAIIENQHREITTLDDTPPTIERKTQGDLNQTGLTGDSARDASITRAKEKNQNKNDATISSWRKKMKSLPSGHQRSGF